MNRIGNRKTAIAIICLIFSAWSLIASAKKSDNGDVLNQITLPAGFEISYFSEDVPNVRSLALGDDGTVYAGTRTKKGGVVYALRDNNSDGKADQRFIIAKDLTMPNGVAYLDGALYIAEVPRLIRLNDIANRLNNPPEPELIYGWFPNNIHHGWKYLRVGPDGKLYLPVGAPCNICKSKKAIFATLGRIDPDGNNFEIIAHGVRNSVGFDWHPVTKTLFFTDNGRDHLGNDIPPDELNQLSKVGQHFGYPYCHGGTIADPEFGKARECKEFTKPQWRFPAHVAPLGIRFYQGDQFPASYRNQLFVAQHGSWNRDIPDGYRIMQLHFKNGQPVSESVFAQGWLSKSGKVSGRPVDILELKDGSLLVSDDKRGVIYRIRYRGKRDD